jgi:hypothetical protein
VRSPAPNKTSGSNRSRTGFVLLMVALISVSVVACGDDDDAADPARFCEINAELEQQRDPLKLPPDEAREAAREFQNLIDESVSVAPDEIRSSVEEFFGAVTAVQDLLAAADFDAEQVDPAELDALFKRFGEGLQDPMDEWVVANCSA